MSILLTGACSALGAEVARLLRPRWGEVKALLYPGEVLPPVLQGLSVVEGDPGRRFSLPGILAGVDTVLHLGGGGNHRRRDRDATFKVELEYTGHLLTAAREVGVRHVIYRSSVFAVGAGVGAPATEDGPWDLDNQPSPRVHALRIAYLEALRQGGLGLPLTVVIPSFLVGPGVEGVLADMFSRVGRGGWVWVPPGGVDVVDVRDVAAQVVALMEAGPSGPWLLAGSHVSYLELCRVGALRSGARCGVLPSPLLKLGSRLPGWEWAPGPEMVSLIRLPWRLDGGRARRVLGFAPRSWQESVGDFYREVVS